MKTFKVILASGLKQDWQLVQEALASHGVRINAWYQLDNCCQFDTYSNCISKSGMHETIGDIVGSGIKVLLYQN